MKKRVLSMVLALSMMLTLFPASAFAAGDTGGGISPDQVTPQSVDTENADTTRQNPPIDAYTVSYKGNFSGIGYAPGDNYLDYPISRWVEILELAPVKTNASDTTDYGKATLHFYEQDPDTWYPDYTKEVQATDYFVPGKGYWVVVQTAGNENYAPASYTARDSRMRIPVSKLYPVASNYTIKITTDSASYDITSNPTIPYGTNYDLTFDVASDAGAVESVTYYKSLNGYLGSQLDSKPTEKGEYVVRLSVAEADLYKSYTVDNDTAWTFTIGDAKQDPDNFAYSLQRNGEAFSYGHFSCEDWAGKTLADLKLTAAEAAGDTTDYGEATVHFYPVKPDGYSYVPDYDNEIPATTKLEAGHSYYAAVKTAGNDTYNARLYTDTAAEIYVLNPAPKADNYSVKLTTSGGTIYDFTEAVVVPYGTTYDFTGSKTTSTAGDVYGVYYRNTSDSDAEWKYVSNKAYPAEPGKYQIGLGVESTGEYSEGIVTKDNWVFTIGQAELDDATIKSSFTFADGKVTASDALTDKVGTITTVYYDADGNKVAENELGTDGKPTQPGTYGIGFTMTESASYKEYDSKGAVSTLGTYTVKANPEPQNYTVRLNGVDVTKLTVDNGLVYNKRLVIDAEANKGVTTGAVLGIYVAPVQATGQVDLTHLYENDPDLLKLLLVPGTYQVVLSVDESDKTRADELFTSSNWHFTINKATVDKADYSKFTYDADAQTITVPSAYSAHISSDDITVLYYQNDKVVSKGTAPTEPGTYQVGFSIQETEYYKALEGTGPVSDWSYIVKDAPKAENYEVTVNGFDITELDAPIKYQQQITVEAEAKSGTGTGDVCSDTIQYALVQADGKPDFDHAVSLDKLVPGTYQVRFEVTGSNLYNSGYVTDTAWRFTVEKGEPASSDFTYDPTTNTFTHLPFGVEDKDVTIQYYTEDGKPVTDFVKDADGNLVPRMAGTYQVGFTVKETEFYKGDTFTGAETGWTYEKERNIVTIDDFVVTAPDAEISYTGDPVTVKAEPNDNIQPVQYEVVYYDITSGYPGTKLDKAPTDAGTYTWSILVTEDDNTMFASDLLGTPFTITKNTDLDDAITVNVPTNVREGDETGFEVTVTIKDATLTADDLEITYIAEDGTESAEAPTTAGIYTYKVTVKDSAKNFTAGSALSGNYTILSNEPTVTGGELTTEDPDALLLPGTKVILTADDNTDVSVFRQWVISVDGVEIEPTVEGLAKLGVTVEDDAAALEALRQNPFTFTMPEGKLSIYALTSNPEQEAFDKAVGTALIVTGATAATGAVYFFGTTAFIRSVLPEGMAVPQNREQLAVALWTLAGKPAVESTAVFTDVAADSEALPAIRWAVETGVLSANTTEDGTSFHAGSYVTRAETALRIFKLQKQLAE